MNLYELHKLFLDYFYPDRSIDWMNYGAVKPRNVLEERDDKPPIKHSSTTYHKLSTVGLWTNSYSTMVPRNNWYEKPYPRPLTHGMAWWPWNGYVKWYDDRAPPKRQYSWYTDRRRDMWPDLNLVHVDATTTHLDKYVFLRFETYTPNFSHFEVNENDTGWKSVSGDRWTWVLDSGVNTLRVRAVNKLGVTGKPSEFELFRADVSLKGTSTLF